VHTVFSTKDRRPLLRDATLRQELHHYLGGILKYLVCQPITVLRRYELACNERYVWD
jgi:hypothetical protein